MSAEYAYGEALAKLEYDAQTGMKTAVEAIKDEEFDTAADVLRTTADLVEQHGNTVDHLEDLSEGDEVLFNDRTEPCTVTEEASGNGRDYWHLTLEGPRGARLKLRQEGQIIMGPNRTKLSNLRLA